MTDRKPLMADRDARAELRRLLADATPAPWVQMRTGIISEAAEFADVDDGDEYDFGSCTVDDGGVDHPEDAALIVAARNALPDLLDHLDEADEAIATLTAAVKAATEVVAPSEGMSPAPDCGCIDALRAALDDCREAGLL